MKKILLSILLIAFCLVGSLHSSVAFADTGDELEEELENGLSNIDFTDMDEVSEPFVVDVVEKIRQIINGEFDTTETFLELVGSLVQSDISYILPQLVCVFCILVICGLARHTSDGFVSKETSDVVSFVGVMVIATSVLSLIVAVYQQISEMLSQTSALADASMPILLTLVVANGGSATSSVCQPSMVLFSSAVISLVQNLLLPLSVFGTAFVVVSNISSNLRVEKLSEFFNSASIRILGVVFTLFSAFTAVQGVTAASIDGVSFRAAKFAAKNYIPILGGYISDGFDIVVASTSLIKNSFGAVTLLVLFFIVSKPLVSLLCVDLGLQAVAAFAEPIVDPKYIKILNGLCKNLTFLSALVFAVTFMFCILVFIAISCANFA